ncbi:MAG: GGDEF domain-containing protein [Patescibacteria group bacterium]
MKKNKSIESFESKIAELEQKIRVLEADLIHDALTGLKTRRFFEEEAKKYFNSISNKPEKKRREWFNFKHLSFIFFDIDHFKKINDTHGHATGDGVLKVVAKTIQEGIRSADIAARWGGEEMVVALLGVNENGAKKKAEQIRKSIERLSFNNLLRPESESDTGSDQTLLVTVSAGVSSFETEKDFDEIVNRADKALYKAKNSGRNKVITWSELSPETPKVKPLGLRI